MKEVKLKPAREFQVGELVELTFGFVVILSNPRRAVETAPFHIITFTALIMAPEVGLKITNWSFFAHNKYSVLDVARAHERS